MNNTLRGNLVYKGERGYSAYEIAQQNGFKGSEETWLTYLGTSKDIRKMINETEADLNARIDGLASGSPLVASSVDEMTETNKTYVNNTDGNWYYYDGSTWNIGGVYQSTKLGVDEVNYTNLDTKLKKLITDNDIQIYHSPEYEVWGKFINWVDTQIQDSPNACMLKIPVADGLIIGLDYGALGSFDIYGGYVKDDVLTSVQLFKAWSNTTDAPTSVNLYNKYNEEQIIYYIIPPGDYEYFVINKKIVSANYDADIVVYSLNDFFNENNLRKIGGKAITLTDYSPRNLELDGIDIKGSIYKSGSSTTNGFISSSQSSSSKCKLLKLGNKTLYLYIKQTKGNDTSPVVYTYDYNYVVKRGITSFESVIIGNEKYYLATITPEEGENFLAYNLESSSVGYSAFVSDKLCTNFKISEINDTELNPSNFGLKNWYAIGDSITHKNSRALYNYVDYCSSDLNLNCINLGASGTGYKKTTNTFIKRLDSITDYNADTDIITVMGSINDISFVADSLGTLGDQTTDTLYGSMYTFFNTLFTKFVGCRVGVITPISHAYSPNNEEWDKYRKALIDTAKLFNVPILDITDMCNLRPWDTAFKNEFFKADGVGSNGEIDGTHPNSKGHKMFYARVREFLKTL